MAKRRQPVVPGRRPDPVGGYDRRLVIMVKEPVAGRVKTRLGRDIGVAHATRFYRQTLAAVTARLARDPRWRTLLSVAPATAVASRSLPHGVPRLAQQNGDIGDRMQAIFDVSGAGPVVVIGTDIPAVRPSHIADAFRALGDNDIVFGPATDGGFWLIGMRRTPRVVNAFHDVRWSTEYTLQDCLNGLNRAPSIRVATIATLRDADERADLELQEGVVGRHLAPVVACVKLEISF